MLSRCFFADFALFMRQFDIQDLQSMDWRKEWEQAAE